MTYRQAVFSIWGACLIWGAAFPLVKLALADATPMAFTAARFLLATALLIPVLRDITRDEWRWGGLLGLLLALGFASQTVGLDYTTPSRSGFLTALYIPFTPLIVFAVYRALPDRIQALGLVLAMVGMLLLTGGAELGSGINRGDALSVLCAAAFAAHMVATSAAGRHGRRVERLMAAQIVIAGAATLVVMPLVETPRIGLSAIVIGVVAYEAVFASLIAIRLQLSAQQVLTPTYTALVFTLEPVIAAGTSFVLTGERLAVLQWLGGGLILAASILPAIHRRSAAAGTVA